MPREIVEISKITYSYGKFHNVPMICQIHMVYKMPVGGDARWKHLFYSRVDRH